MSRWLTKFLEKKSEIQPDKPDRFNLKTNMSVMSGPSRELLEQNLRKLSEPQPDKPDRFNPKTNMSVMSGPSKELLEQNLGKLSELQPDKPDRFNSNTNMSVMSGLSGPLHESFEERLAIAEYDGQQTPLQAQRIAYLDAFMAVLATLPYEEKEGHYDEDWLTRRIKVAKNWLAAEELQQPK
jgi:hypothetical protein